MIEDKRNLIKHYLLDALIDNEGAASVLVLAKNIWDNHEEDLRGLGDLFYSWQYDMRWAATELRAEGKLKPATEPQDEIWELA